jgi:hypothetical protein
MSALPPIRYEQAELGTALANLRHEQAEQRAVPRAEPDIVTTIPLRGAV